MPWYFYNNRGVLQQAAPDDPIPVGAIMPFISQSGWPASAPTTPSGWLLCDGGSHATASYPDLAVKIAAPGSPGVTFNVPNWSNFFSIGAGALSVGSAVAVGDHAHGGATANTHGHSNTHYHPFPAHFHGFPHQHDAEHGHGAGTLRLARQNGTTPVTYAESGGATSVPKGPGSGDKHRHDIDGSTGLPIENQLLRYRGLNTSTNGGGNSEAKAIPLDARTTPIINDSVPNGDYLPPYLNVYYIIKAVDLSGTYI